MNDSLTRRPLARAAPGRPGATPRVRLPGSKSLTNRALVLAALSDGPSVVRQALRSRDTELMAAALTDARRRAWTPPATTGRSPRRRSRGPRDRRLRAGRHRDALRAAGRRARRRAGRLRRRPARPAPADAARSSTACAASASTSRTRAAARCRSPSSAPARVRGGEVTIDASASSQFVSALLLAGARYDEGVDVRHDGKPVPVAAAHRDDRRAAARSTASRSTTPTPNRWRVLPAAGPRGRRTRRAGPVQRRAVPRRRAGHRRPGDRAATGRARTTQAGDALREILALMGGDGRARPTTA